MYKSKVLSYFNNSQTAVAAHLQITQPAVAQWGRIIPKAAALELARTTSLAYDAKLYARKAASRARRV